MELIHERQRFPFVFTCVLAVLIIAGSYVLTLIVNPAPASANRFYWYMARSAGFTAYGLLSISVLVGVSTTSAIWDKLKIRKLMTQLHQYISLLILPFLCFHLWALHQDTSIPFPWGTVFVPFSNSYRPIPTGFGVLALYAWLLIVATSYFRGKISAKYWRKFHLLSFPTFLLVTLHGILTGTDSRSGLAMLIYAIPTVLFTVLVIIRIQKSQ